MKIVFFRHMPTANNLSDKFLGRLDLDCDPTYSLEHYDDVENIMKISNMFLDIYCSPLKRAQHTAKIIFPKRNIITDDRLIERDLGEWSDISKKVLRQAYPDAFYENGRLNFLFTPNGGEEFKHLIVRVSNFLLEVYNKYKRNSNIAVVTHNGVITTIKCIEIKDFSDTSRFSFQQYLKPYAIDLNPQSMIYIEKLSHSKFEI